MTFSRKDMNDLYFDQDKIPRIEPETLRQLSKLQPWRSFLAIALDWIVIVVCIVACEKLSYWLYPVAFIIVGTRFHGLEAMMHEATHYRLHPNKSINELVGELSVWPMGLSVFLYRYVRHFSHHKNIGTIKDAHVFQSYARHSERFNIPLPPLHLLKHCLIVALSFPRDLWIGQIYDGAQAPGHLPTLHKLLYESPQIREKMHVTTGLKELIKELTTLNNVGDSGSVAGAGEAHGLR